MRSVVAEEARQMVVPCAGGIEFGNIKRHPSEADNIAVILRIRCRHSQVEDLWTLILPGHERSCVSGSEVGERKKGGECCFGNHCE